MVEQTNVCERHGDAVLVASLDDIIVTDATASLSYVLYATLVSTLDVVAEWEEGIATEANACILSNPSFLLLTGQWLRLLCEELFPNTILKYVFPLVRDIDIDGVVAVGTANLLLESEYSGCGSADRHRYRWLDHP